MAETVDLSSLPRVSYKEQGGLPADPAVYFVLSENDEVLYVGNTGSLSSRWKKHHRARQLDKMEASFIAWVKVRGPKRRADLEREMIRVHRPKLNDTSIPENNVVTAYVPRELLIRYNAMREQSPDHAQNPSTLMQSALKRETSRLERLIEKEGAECPM